MVWRWYVTALVVHPVHPPSQIRLLYARRTASIPGTALWYGRGTPVYSARYPNPKLASKSRGGILYKAFIGHISRVESKKAAKSDTVHAP